MQNQTPTPKKPNVGAGTGTGGILDRSPGSSNQVYYPVEEEQQEKGLWDTAVAWAKSAGEKLAQGEQEVWKAINSKK